MKVMLAGRNAAELRELESGLASQANISVSKRHIVNGHPDPLYHVVDLPDVLVFCTTAAWEEELKCFGERPASMRPSTIVIGAGNTDVMRMAMRIGAKDYFSLPVAHQELIESLHRIEQELSSYDDGQGSTDRLIAVINAKGGSGASTIAATLAHGMADRIGQRVALVDMDVQFGTLTSLFDLPPSGGLVDAIMRSDSIDALAMEGHMLKHKSGLHLLGNTPEQLIVPGEIDEGRLRKLLTVLRSGYDQVIADLPRQIDSITGMILESSDRVLLIVQQSVSHVQDAKQMMRYLTQYLGIPEQRLTVVINRWDKRAPLASSDIEQALGMKEMLCIPNDFARVAESANLGTPLLEAFPSSQVSRAMMRLAEVLSGKKSLEDESGLGKVLRKWARA